MAEEYFSLSPDDQRELLSEAEKEFGRRDVVLEKDIWVCWTLQALFSMPDHHPMAFKGGTSLSKVYGAIDRFSEDVDVTLDYRSFDEDFDPFSDVSNTQIRKFGERLKDHVKAYTQDVVAPYLHDCLSDLQTGEGPNIDFDDESGEKLRVTYRPVTENGDDYLSHSVLIEFGGRNVIDPNERHQVSPMIQGCAPEITFPSSEVVVLSGKRTFWEKATLIHVECNRNGLKENPERLARHWYDLAQLAEHSVGEAAIQDRDLLQDVVRHKKVFFHTGYAQYDACLHGGLRLLPDQNVLRELKRDYDKMTTAGMMYGEPIGFEDILDKIRRLEAQINTR